jgi:hypothetical protein
MPYTVTKYVCFLLFQKGNILYIMTYNGYYSAKAISCLNLSFYEMKSKHFYHVHFLYTFITFQCFLL